MTQPQDSEPAEPAAGPPSRSAAEVQALVRRAQQAIGDPSLRPPVEELELSARHAQLEFEQYVRRQQITRICVGIVLVIALVYGVILYREVNRRYFEASRLIKQLGSVLGARTALVDQLVPATLAERRDRRQMGVLSALPTMQVDTPIESAMPRVEAMERWSNVLFEVTHGPGSRDHENDWTGYELQRQRLIDSEQREREIRHQYNQAARSYNSLMRTQPTRLVGLLTRFPDRVPRLSLSLRPQQPVHLLGVP